MENITPKDQTVSTVSINASQTSRASYRNHSQSFCLKAFIIGTIFLAAVTTIIAAIAVLEYHGVISGMNSIGVIGEVNSYLMLAGGAILFAISLVAWTCHLKKEPSAT